MGTPSRSQNARLKNGCHMPLVGYGISGLEDKTPVGINAALRAGFRLFDLATAPAQGPGFGYRQDILGAVLAESFSGESEVPVKRAELFIQTKVHPMDFGYRTTLNAVERACTELRTDYIDLVLLHWPFCVEEFCGRGEKGRPLGTAIDAYLALVQAQKEGRVRSLGVSNFDASLLEEFVASLELFGLGPPDVLQNPVDPMNPPPKPLRRLLQRHSIFLQV